MWIFPSYIINTTINIKNSLMSWGLGKFRTGKFQVLHIGLLKWSCWHAMYESCMYIVYQFGKILKLSIFVIVLFIGSHFRSAKLSHLSTGVRPKNSVCTYLCSYIKFWCVLSATTVHKYFKTSSSLIDYFLNISLWWKKPETLITPLFCI